MGWRSGRRPSRRTGQGGGGKLTEALRWWLDYGEAYSAAKEAAGEDGEIPEALEPPEIMEGFSGWYADFWRLSTERQVGFGIGPIPASVIDNHVSGWAHEDADMFEHIIRELDRVYMTKQNGTEETDSAGDPMLVFRSATAGRRG